IPEGSVTRTNPGAGATVDKGTGVTIYVSSGPGNVAVPGVVGLTEQNARSMLQGFNVSVTYQPTNDPSSDRIVASQNPPANAQVSLVVYEYREPEPTLPTLPGQGGNG